MRTSIPIKTTWKELKDFCNSLPEEVLNNDVHWWGDERGGFVAPTSTLEEDYLLTDEGWEPISSFQYDPRFHDGETEEEYNDYVKSLPKLLKGLPIISVDAYKYEKN